MLYASISTYYRSSEPSAAFGGYRDLGRSGERRDMASRMLLFGLLLGVPALGVGVSAAIQAHFNSELRSTLLKELPNVDPDKAAQFVTFVEGVCAESPREHQDLCATNNVGLTLMRRAALGAGVVGLGLLMVIRLAGALARSSRTLLVATFKPGLYLTVVVLIGLIMVHAAVAMAAIYFGESALVGRVHVGLIAAIGLGAVAGVITMARSAFTLVQKAETIVIGKALSREEAPRLWTHVDEIAARLDALRPENLVVGLDPNFFVTEASVVCLSGTLNGRTLYCSLPLCRILSSSEFTAVVGHELGHFKGQDTRFSKRFYPIYRGSASCIAALQVAGGEGSGVIALLPAIAVLSYFLESFSSAERRLSRDRELAADQTGAGVTDSQVMATALVKVHAFSGVWAGLQQAAAKAVREGRAFVNASAVYADAVSRTATAEALHGITETHLSHPTDTHPPLSARLQSLRLTLADVSSAALAVTPSEPAIDLLLEAERHEQEISQAYQALLANQLGIDVETAGSAASGGGA